MYENEKHIRCAESILDSNELKCYKNSFFPFTSLASHEILTRFL